MRSLDRSWRTLAQGIATVLVPMFAVLVALVTIAAAPVATKQPQNKVVLLALRVGDTVFQTGIRDGGTSKVTLPDGLRLEVVPSTVGELLDLQVWSITADPVSGQDRSVMLLQTRLPAGGSATFQAGGSSVEITWTGLKDSMSGASPDGCTECCMTCGGTTVCACIVEAPCGRCCCGFCCDIGNGVNRTATNRAPKPAVRR